jgi:hypothetical protein
MTDAQLKALNPHAWKVRRLRNLLGAPHQDVRGRLAIQAQFQQWSPMESLLSYLDSLTFRGTIAWLTVGLLCVGAAYWIVDFLTSIARWFR